MKKDYLQQLCLALFCNDVLLPAPIAILTEWNYHWQEAHLGLLTGLCFLLLLYYSKHTLRKPTRTMLQ